ncbi:hypothetical protein RRF57_005130 [Xylaria bambusicola]|uniref:DUF7703 domain-containing protein n=1 Tax=Xylaria bambusicola TaxID=326684 RepID=A0AAN7UBL9_9PEZI
MERGVPGEAWPTLEPVPRALAMGLSALIAIALRTLHFHLSHIPRSSRALFLECDIHHYGDPAHAAVLPIAVFGLANPGLMASLISVWWLCMVTGQSLMLYSRLHLVLLDTTKTRWLLCMIIGVFLLIGLPAGTLFALNNFLFTGKVVAAAYNAMEKIELVIFTLQECLLSGLYLYEWSGVRKELEITKGPRVRTLFYELIGLFFLVLALDLSLVGLQFSNRFRIQITYKPVVYSIKLKLEIYILNNLVALVNSNDNCQQRLPFRNQTIPLHTRAEDDPWRFPNIHSVNAAGSMARHGSNNSTVCGSLSTTGSKIAKIPRNILDA